MRAKPPAKLLVLVALTALLGACSETKLAGRAPNQAEDSGGTTGKGAYKVGKPYQINGVWYYPAEDYNYSETGVASWYGPDFHGKYTANGEIFDQNALTAAHRTLPMPCYVRVTNLQNGRQLVVRVNDRGPFAHSRILDLSRRSAEMLGIVGKGTAPVKVEIMAEESRALAAALKNGQPAPDEPMVAAAPQATVSAESLPPPGSKEKPRQLTSAPRVASRTQTVAEPVVDQSVREVPVAGSTKMYIQAGAFSRYDNANRMRAQLASVGQANITTVRTSGGELYRVRMGPIGSYEEADQLLEKVIRNGASEARVIVD